MCTKPGKVQTKFAKSFTRVDIYIFLSTNERSEDAYIEYYYFFYFFSKKLRTLIFFQNLI